MWNTFLVWNVKFDPFTFEKNMFSPRTQWVLNKLDGFNGIQFAKHILQTQGHICHLSRPTDYLFYLSFSLQDEIDSHQIVNSIHKHLSDNDQLYFNSNQTHQVESNLWRKISCEVEWWKWRMLRQGFGEKVKSTLKEPVWEVCGLNIKIPQSKYHLLSVWPELYKLENPAVQDQLFFKHCIAFSNKLESNQGLLGSVIG